MKASAAGAQAGGAGSRRSLDDLTTKGRQTRASLIAAAREVFRRSGYFESRLSEITDLAGVSTGTLYTYFDDRVELLHALIEAAYGDSLRPAYARPVEMGDPVARIHAGNRTYVEAYERSADLMAIFDQAEHLDPRLHELRSTRAKSFFARNEATIVRLQELGRVDPALDHRLAGTALSLMVSRQCHYTYVVAKDPEYAGPEGARRLADGLTRLWLSTLGLDPDAALAEAGVDAADDSDSGAGPDEPGGAVGETADAGEPASAAD